MVWIVTIRRCRQHPAVTGIEACLCTKFVDGVLVVGIIKHCVAFQLKTCGDVAASDPNPCGPVNWRFVGTIHEGIKLVRVVSHADQASGMNRIRINDGSTDERMDILATLSAYLVAASRLHSERDV